MSRTHDVAKLKAKIKAAEDEHRATKHRLVEEQRKLSAHDRVDSKKKDEEWRRTRWSLGESVGIRIREVGYGREDLTKLYMARASLRGRLHCTKQIVHHSNGTKKEIVWTLEKQAAEVKDLLKDFKLPDAPSESKVA